jgi:hypothetical protein
VAQEGQCALATIIVPHGIVIIIIAPLPVVVNII